MRWANDKGDIITVSEIDDRLRAVMYEIKVHDHSLKFIKKSSIEDLCNVLDEGRYEFIEEDDEDGR